MDFPTAQEWTRRQRTLPLAAKQSLAAADAARRDRDAARQREIDEHDAATTAHRAAFEAALAATLAEAGAEWLAAFRVPDDSPFRGPRETFAFSAQFNPVHRGLWPVRLALGFWPHDDEDGPRYWGGAEWSVIRPGDSRGFSTFLLAIECAAELGNPF